MFLAGSCFLWDPPNLLEVSSVSCLCSCSRTFYSTVTRLVILPTVPAPGDLCHFWHLPWLPLLIKQEEILSYFLTFWNYVKSNFHNELLLVHSYPSSLTCFQRLVLHFSDRAEKSKSRMAHKWSLCTFLKFVDPYSVPFFTPIVYNYIEFATFLQWFPVHLNTILAS